MLHTGPVDVGRGVQVGKAIRVDHALRPENIQELNFDVLVRLWPDPHDLLAVQGACPQTSAASRPPEVLGSTHTPNHFIMINHKAHTRATHTHAKHTHATNLTTTRNAIIRQPL